MDSVAVEFVRAVIVRSEQEQQLETVALAVAAFPSKVGTLLMKALGASAPLTNLKHLKRVRKAPEDGTLLEAILCSLEGDDSPPAASPADTSPSSGSATSLDPSRLPEALQALYAQHSGQRLCVVCAAATAPHTKQQWEAWTKLWPITWRIPDHGIPVTEETLVTEHKQQYFEHHMRAALQLASREAVDNAALIVDPTAHTPVAESADRSATHPLQHAVMAAVQVASERDLVQWPNPVTIRYPSSDRGNSDQEPVEGSHDALCTAGGAGPQEQGSSTAGAPRQKPEHNGVGQNTGLADAGMGDEGLNGELACKRPRLGAGPDEAKLTARSQPYMCTGYDCFVVREPCIMCAMALVHSRVQRVIYCRPDARFGALGGSRRLHACKSLNHNYEVYCLELKSKDL